MSIVYDQGSKQMARILNITPAQYHADPCWTPSLSASTAKTIILKSPAHACLEHPKLGGVSRETTDSMDKGTIIHELVMGKGSGIVIVEADDFRTKAAQAIRDEAFAAGKTPVIAKKMEAYQFAADKIICGITELIGRPIPTQREVCIEWEYKLVSGAMVLCRSMLDAVDLEAGFILDLKTCASAHQLDVERACCNMGYDIQGAAYEMALGGLKPELMGRIDIVFAFAETEGTFSVTPGRFSGPMKALGDSRWNRAAEKWNECLKSNKWPHYTSKVVTLYPPVYEIAREEEIRQCEL
jgi:PDDEXK-like domain of unknown function (DUF3799)